ncbi:MAG: SURF1 family protein [Halofilum sp. (in: g-proteobacteria)]|nr:SURF1 family protein [Halofilum sp. (in: g-proteobacteria)]
MSTASSRHRPRWLPWLAALAALALFSGLGAWQLQRAGEKRELLAALERGAAAPARALAGTPAGLRQQAFARVRARGRFLDARQFLLDNRTLRGRTGFDVLTPLVLAGGRTVLVDRGWIAAGPAPRARRPDRPGTEGTVRVTGRLWLPAGRRRPGACAGAQRGLAAADDARGLQLPWRRPSAAAGACRHPAADGEAPWVLEPRGLEPAFGPARHYGYAGAVVRARAHRRWWSRRSWSTGRLRGGHR